MASGKTEAWNTTRPSASRWGDATPGPKEVTLRASPPAASSAHNWEPPSRVDRNAMVLPSRVQAGDVSALSENVSCFTAPEVRSAIQMLVRRLDSFRSWLATSKSSLEPSGDRLRWEMSLRR